MTIFNLLRLTCGLSHQEAADFLGVRIDTVKSWAAGRNRTPGGVIDSLVELAAKIDAAADQACEVAEGAEEKHSVAGQIDLVTVETDEEAQELGWPCVGAHQAMLGLAIARLLTEGYGPINLIAPTS